MHKPLAFRILLGTAGAFALSPAYAEEPIDVVASFSILANMVEQVGGDHVAVTSLVGPDSDTHVFSPSPTHARALTEADLVVFNGLQFEGWMERLIESSDYDGPLVIATDGIDALAYHGHEHEEDAHGHDEHEEDAHGHDEHDDHAEQEEDGHGHGDRDPHAWQNLALSEVYVTNIRDGLIEADPDNADTYRHNAERYIQEIESTNAKIRSMLSEIPDDTAVVTGHDSFGYFANAYGIRFLSPAGLSTEVDPSAADMAQLIDVIRDQDIKALFHESMTNPTTIDQLAEETGVPIAGTLYADALASEGDASTYLGMMHHNANVLYEALAEPGHDDGDREHSHDDDHDDGHDDHDHGHSH